MVLRLLLLVQILSLAVFAQPELSGAEELPYQPIAPKLKIGGWVDVMLQDSEIEDNSLEIPHIYLFGDADLSNRMRGFFEVRRAFRPQSQGLSNAEISLERAYLEYRSGIPFKLRVGKFNTPAGLWKQNLWSILVDTTRKPLVEDKDFIPSQAVGAEILGKRMLGNLEFSYDVLVSQSEVGNHTHEGHGDLGFGADVSVSWDMRLRAGVFYYDHQNHMEGNDPLPGNRKATLAYVDYQLLRNRLTLRSEFLHMQREATMDINSYYGKIKWQPLTNLYFNYRFDDSDVLEDLQPVRHTVHTLTLGYRLNPRLRARLEFADHNLDTAAPDDYREHSLWLGFLF